MSKKRDNDLDREIRTHLELEAEEQIAGGMSPADAAHAARRAFGNVTRTREDVREVWTRRWLGDVWQDLRHASRTLRKSPGFALVALTTLALGIGANSAVFSLVHTVLVRPLPFVEPDRLVVVWEDFSQRGGPATVNATPGNFGDWREQNRVFADMAAVSGRLTFNLTGDTEPERLSGAKVTGSLFSLLGLPPIAGRTIQAEDDRPGADPVAVISEGLWRRRFGADPQMVGRRVVLDDIPHTVVGIVPGHFQFPAGGTEVWVPMAFTPEQSAARTTWYLEVIARLKPGVAFAQAQADMSAVARRLEQEYPRTNPKLGVRLVALHEQYAGGARSMLMLLLAAAVVVLLIACVNVAHLLMTRGTERRKEIAVRGALGAGRGRVLRQLVTESALLAGVATLGGIVLAAVALRFLDRLIPSNFPEGMGLELNAPMLLFTAAAAVLTTVAFGVGPALTASRFHLHDALRPSGTRGSSRRERSVRGAMVVAEVSMTVVLLIAAGLLLRSYVQLSSVNVGFPAGGLLVAETPLSPSRYGTAGPRLDFVSAALARVEALPGVASAGYVNFPPLTFPGGRSGFLIEGRPAPTVDQVPRQLAINRAVSSGYLETLGVPLIRGRLFDDRDGPGAAPVVVINETMARTFWRNENPIGRQIRFGPPNIPTPWVAIVGVVGDVHQVRLDAPAEPELYLAFAQFPAEASPPFVWPRYLVVRTTGEPMTVAQDVRRAIASVAADQPVSNIRTMERVIGEQLIDRSTHLTLIGGFSILALLIAGVGLYGVLAYAVVQQTAEIGLRMALGASRAIVLKGLVRRMTVLTGIGIALGLGGALAVTRLFSSLLFEVSPVDPAALVAGPLALIAVGALACWVPARRATRVDPLVALRAE